MWIPSMGFSTLPRPWPFFKKIYLSGQGSAAGQLPKKLRALHHIHQQPWSLYMPNRREKAGHLRWPHPLGSTATLTFDRVDFF